MSDSIKQIDNATVGRMSVNGTVRYSDIEGTPYARAQIMQIIQEAEPLAVLNNPNVVYSASASRLEMEFPTLGRVPVAKQLDELEETPAQNAGVDSYKMRLKKDRIKLSISDEARIAFDLGDPMELQRRQSAFGFARVLEEQIIDAIQLTPQTMGAPIDFSTQDPMMVIGEMAMKLLPYTPTALVMSPYAFAKYAAALGHQIFIGQTSADLGKARAMVPGYEIPIYVCSTLNTYVPTGGALADSDMYMVSSQVPAVIVGEGTIKARQWDDNDKGAYYYQYDVFRSVSSGGNVFQTDAGQNAGVVQATVVKN